jgi:carboxymethylenebutenolidase
VAINHEVKPRTAAYRSGDADVPVSVLVPQGKGPFPVVVFLHGRRGVDDVTRLVPLRLAARGFVVVVPDLYAARFIETMPVKHDPATEEDAARAIDFALSLPEAKGQSKTCVVSHTRGGYYALKALVTHGRQSKVACTVAYYPHWQHPEAPEAAQVYQHAQEIDQLSVPTQVFMGEHEQYQRARAIASSVDVMRARKRDVALIVYPGVGRGFEFRGPAVRTFADDLAAKDAMLRSATFIRSHLGRHR